MTTTIQRLNFDDRMEIYDDGAFTIFKSHYGMWNSRDREGNGLSCGLDKEAVIFWSRERLNGWQNSYAVTTNVSFQGQDTMK